jgi:hypothetical protein
VGQLRERITPRREHSVSADTFPVRNYSLGCANGYASCARPAPRWLSTRSPLSDSSGNQDRTSLRGPLSWPGWDARRSSSAHHAMTGSTQTRSRARRNRWRARYREILYAGFGGRLPGKGPHPQGMRDLAGQPTLPGVTTCQGGRESRPQGEGGQVIGHHNPGGMRNAERRNGTGCPA